MPKFHVTTTVDFSGVVEAANEDEAEELGRDWKTNLKFDSIFDIEVEEHDEDDD